jgi:transcription initiation factor IIE alpha subunit
MYKCPNCSAEYNQADAYSQELKCMRCNDTDLVIDTQYTTILEGTKKGERFVKKLTEMMKGLEDDTLPESFIVNKRIIAELAGQKIIGKKRKKRDGSFLGAKESKVRIYFMIRRR